MNEKSVLIIGAGPVGLSLAVALINKGIKVEVYEEGATLNKEIRASTFHAKTLEMMDQWGVIDDVLANGNRVEKLQYWDRQQKKLVANFDYSILKDTTKFPFRLQCPQHIYTRTIAPRVEDSPLSTIHYGHKLVRFEEANHGINAWFQTEKGLVKKEGVYLCAADGADSTVRKFLNLDFSGMTYEDRFLLIGTRVDMNKIYPGMGPVNYIFDPEEWVIILNLINLTRIVFQVPQGESNETALSDSSISRRMDRFLEGRVPWEPLSRSIYRVHQRVAETFRVGRALLLGDAAHINNPASGMGMNSGIHDAWDLATSIEQVLTGKGDEVLDQYSERRRSYALESIKTYTAKRFADLGAKDPEAQKKRNSELSNTAQNPQLAKQYLMRASMLDMEVQ